MFPIIGTGDRITISPERNPGVGDIIVFKKNETMVCHRLVKTFEKDGARHYQTRGDSFFSPDEPVTPEQIVGKVISIDRSHVSLARKMLLLVHPFLKHCRLNALMVNVLLKVKNLLFHS